MAGESAARRFTTRGFGVSSLVPHDVVERLASAAEESGYAMFWVNDIPGGSGVASLGVAGRAAKGIELGVGVLAVDRWTPETIAAEVRRAGVDPGRLTVGLGAGRLTDGSLDAVARTAEGMRGLGARRVVVGSLGPRMTRLGVTAGDGVLLNWVTPEAAASLADLARDGAQPGTEWISAYTRVAAESAAEAGLVAECAAYEGYPAYARHFERLGVRARDTAVNGGREEVRAWLAGFDGVVDHVVVRAIAAEETVEGYLAVLRAGAPGPA